MVESQSMLGGAEWLLGDVDPLRQCWVCVVDEGAPQRTRQEEMMKTPVVYQSRPHVGSRQDWCWARDTRIRSWTPSFRVTGSCFVYNMVWGLLRKRLAEEKRPITLPLLYWDAPYHIPQHSSEFEMFVVHGNVCKRVEPSLIGYRNLETTEMNLPKLILAQRTVRIRK